MAQFNKQQSNIAIILTGLPGSGKTTLAQVLLQYIPNSLHIEIDMFYSNGKSNNKMFLEHIATSIMTNNIIICKNYYNKKSLNETLLLLTNYRYYVFNLVPEEWNSSVKLKTQSVSNVPQDFISYDISGNINRMYQDMYIEKLLDRIEKRTDESSPMKICNLDMRQRAKQVIINAFVKKYETLEPCFYLDSFDTIDNNIARIMDKIKLLEI
jgi:adenylate kinase family enzyme